MAIDFKRKEYADMLDIWTMIDNVCDSTELEQYLFDINSNDDSDEMEARRDQIRQLAVFYEVAGYTAAGFLGLVFEVDPTFNVPTQLEYLRTNADGMGNSIFQQSQATLMNVIRKSRGGLWVDYPETPGGVSVKDMESGNIFAPIIRFDAKQIINWRYKRIGAKMVLCLVVIETTREVVGEDGYEIEYEPIIKELYLDEDDGDIYKVRTWVQDEANAQWHIEVGEGIVNPVVPKQGNGKEWNEIPFTFVGAEDNTANINKPAMLRICRINLAHYNNSAIYEDFVWVMGQAAPWMSGLTKDHLELMQENHMYFGCANMIGVPAGEQFGIAQAQENSIVKEAMDDKREMMIGLGAMFITPGSAVKTATQSGGEQKVQHSILSLMAANVSEAYQRCLEWAALFMNTTLGQDHGYSLNQDFVEPDSTPQMLTAVVADFMQGSMPISDFFQWKKDNGFTYKETLEEFQDDIEQAQQDAIDLDNEKADAEKDRTIETVTETEKAKAKNKPKPAAKKKAK